MITARDNKLLWLYDGERMQIEAWGKDSVRVRVTRVNRFSGENWALKSPADTEPVIRISDEKDTESGLKVNAEDRVRSGEAEFINGKIRVKITRNGKLLFYNQHDRLLLGEYEYDRHTSLNISSRELKSKAGGLFRASMKFASDPAEKLYGMGQYQNGIFNLKGSFLELAQRNSQKCVGLLLYKAAGCKSPSV